jgi:hypothetical protein
VPVRVYFFIQGVDVYINDIAQFALRKIGDAHIGHIAFNPYPFVILGVF